MIEERKFHRYSISLQDFRKASEFLVEAKKHPYGSLIHEALLFSAIICYYRPFSPNEKEKDARASSRLDLTDFPTLTTDEAQVHELCKELRNKALAHSEFKYHPTSLNPETGVISTQVFSLVGKAPNLDSLTHLIEKLAERC